MTSLAERDSRRVYEAWHQDVQSASAKADRPWHELLWRYLRSEDLAGRRVLDIGCGRGELACRVVTSPDAPRHLMAADLAQSAVELGRQRARHTRARGLAFAVSSIQDIPAADSTFDTVLSCETIEHVVEPIAALREIRRVLRPGGRLLLTTPNYLGPLGLYRAYLRLRGRRYTEGGQPICHLTSIPRTIMWCRRAGLIVRAADAVGHYLPWPGRPPRHITALDAIPLLHLFALHSLVVAEKP